MTARTAADNPFAASTTHALRGDYSNVSADYTVAQPAADSYTAEEQARWRFLYDRQSKLLRDYAAPEYVRGLEKLSAADAIPRLDDASDVLRKATGWELVAVPGLIPNDAFFRLLANRKFPVAWWMRRAEELDYLVEPDIFHDFFGHVPLLSDPVFADYMQAYGEGGIKAIRLDADHLLARLYWYVVEFGLVRTDSGVKAFGAGMLSSKGETIYSVEHPHPHRVAYDMERVLRTDYLVDDYQKTYFVVESFDQLFEDAKSDLTPVYERIKALPTIDPETLTDTDVVIHRGRWPAPRPRDV